MRVYFDCLLAIFESGTTICVDWNPGLLTRMVFYKSGIAIFTRLFYESGIDLKIDAKLLFVLT